MRNIIEEKEVKVLGINYKISLFDSPGRADGSMGRSDVMMGKITICKDMPQDIQEQTLWHEILHVIDTNVGTKLTEEQVTALSGGLYSVIKENNL
jgi:hypothetical protein